MSVDKDKIEEIRQNYREKAEHEISLKKKNDETFGSTEEETIKEKFNRESDQTINQIMNMGPKRLFQLNLSDNPNGWRRGYTKSPIGKGVAKRRKRNRMARKSRAQQRIKE
jgi:hypothetical protein